MKRNNFVILMALAMTVFISLPVIGQTNEETYDQDKSTQDSGEDNSIKLNTVVVTATRTQEKLKDVPVNVDVITSKDIEASGINTLGDIIGQRVTGHYHRYSGLSQPAGIMGNFTADVHGDDIQGDVLVLVDGHRLGTGNIGKIPPELIERVEVIKGPASALYGSAAMGGVINIITKKGSGDIKNTVKVEAGSFDYKKTALTSGGSINDTVGYFIAFSLMSMGDYRTKEYGKAYNTSESQAQVWGNLNFNISSRQDLRLGFSYADIESHYPDWANWTAGTYYNDSVKQYTDRSRGHADAEYNFSLLQNKLHWKASVYYLWDRNAWYSGDESTGEKVEDDASIYNDSTIGTDQQFTISMLPYNKIVVGYTFEYLKKDSEALTDGEESIPFTPNLSYMTNGLYAQDSIKILDDLNIILGARYDVFTLSSETTTGEDKEETYDHFSPRGGVVYNIADIMRIRGNVGHAFKTPSAGELTMKHKTAYANYMGNPDLKPESSTTYDAGLDVYFKNIDAGVTYSFIKTKDRIVRIDDAYTDSDGITWSTFENIGKSEMEIIDCYLEFALGQALSLPVGIDLVSNITINRRYENTETGEDLPFIADREVKSNVNISYKKTSAALSHVYIGHEILDDGSEKASFYFFNLTAQYEITNYLSAEIGIFNLTNKDYEWVDGYPMAERNYKIGVTGKF